MIFGNCWIYSSEMIMINNIEFKKIQIKFPWLVINIKLCWKPHISYIKNVIFTLVLILYKSKQNKKTHYRLLL